MSAPRPSPPPHPAQHEDREPAQQITPQDHRTGSPSPARTPTTPFFAHFDDQPPQCSTSSNIDIKTAIAPSIDKRTYCRRTNIAAAPCLPFPHFPDDDHSSSKENHPQQGPNTEGPACDAVTRHGRMNTTRLSDRAVANMIKRTKHASGGGDFAGHSLVLARKVATSRHPKGASLTLSPNG